MKKTRVVVISGGTGSGAVSELAKKENLEITIITSASDRGGASGQIIDAQLAKLEKLIAVEGGHLVSVAPGDITSAMIALSEHPEEVKDLFNYRFGNTLNAWEGQSVKNLLAFAAMNVWKEEARWNNLKAVFRMRGSVYPISPGFVDMEAELADGSKLYKITARENDKSVTLTGEAAIDYLPYYKHIHSPIIDIHLKSIDNQKICIGRNAETAIKKADIIMIAPSDLWTSITPILKVPGTIDAINESGSKIIFFCPLMSKRLHTDGFTLWKFVEILQNLGLKIDVAVYNDCLFSESEDYKNEGSSTITLGTNSKSTDTFLVMCDLINTKIMEQDPNDSVKRSILRHDAEKVEKITTAIIRKIMDN